MHLNNDCKRLTLRIIIEQMILILFLAGVADATTVIWDEELGSPLPYTWNYTNFDGFNISGNGTENITILQANLSAGQRTIDKDNLTYTTTAQAKKLNVVAALNLTSNADMALRGLEQVSPGRAFENGQYYILNWQAQKYVALNGKVDKLTKQVIEQGISEKKTMMVGESWNIGDGWAVTVQSIDARATPRQIWLTLSKDGIKKDDKVIAQGMIYTYVEKSIAGETDVPLFVTYVDSVFSGETSDLVQLKYTWAISPSVIQIWNSGTYGVFTNADIDQTIKKMSLRNGNTSVVLYPNTIIDLTGNIKFNVTDNATSLKFYPTVEPKLSVATSSIDITAGIPTNVVFTVTANGSPVVGAAVNLSGVAIEREITDTNGKATISVNASNTGTIIAEAEKAGYAKGTTTLQAAYSIPSTAMASWNLQENYALNLVDIDAKATPRQARFQLLKNNKAVDDAILYVGQKYHYNSSNLTIFTADVDAIFSGTQGNLVELMNASQYSESNGIRLTINVSNLFKYETPTGIEWQLDEGYDLKMMDIDVKGTPRQVWLELLKNNLTVDDAVVSLGQTYTYNNSTNSRVLNGTVDVIFNGTQGNLVRLINLTQYSETNGTPLLSNEVHLYKSANFTGIGWQLDEGYNLKMMDVDVKATPRQVWFELLKDNITKDDSILSHGTLDSNKNYFYSIPGRTILTAKVDGIFKGETSSIVKLIEVNQYSETNGTVLINNSSHTFISGDINGINQSLYENYTISALGTDVSATPRLVWLRLFKNTTAVDDKMAMQGDIYRYYNTTNALIIYAEVDSIFVGATSNAVKLRNVTQYSELNGSILINGATYILFTNGSGAGGGGGGGSGRNGITYPINNSAFAYGEMIMLSGNANFSAPPYTYNWTSSIDGLIGSVSKILTYSLSPGIHVITLNVTDMNGTSNTSSKTITVYPANTSVVSGVNATGPMAWSVYDFPAFWQEGGIGGNTSEKLSVAAISGERNISTGDLYYNITRQLMPYKVYSEAGKTVDYGLDSNGNKVPSGSHYAKIGWFGRPYVAIAGKANKLAKLVLEYGIAADEKKILGVGETWNMGDGWTLTANSIDAKASPRQVWLTLSKDGIKKDDKVIAQGDAYVYVERSYAGEIDVPLFVTYIDSIFAGATSDMVQLRYTWLISDNPIVLDAGDKIGILTAVETNDTGVEMSNLDYDITLTQGSIINIADGLRFKVNNTPTLDYYPEMTIIGSALPFWNPTPSNQTVELGASFSYDVNAKCLQTITYSVNDTTNFSVNPSTGLITNATALSVGVYWLNITAIDASGGSISQVITITVRDTIPPANNNNGGGGSGGSSSSGGGGGGGGTSGESYTNIEVKEKYDLYIFKDKVTSYAFTNRSNAILFVNITGNINAGEITTTAEVLRNTSSFVKNPAPGIVYKNINIWVGTSGFAVPKNIKEAVVKFKVETSWLNSNSLAEDDVKMFRWDGSKWNALETLMKDKDDRFTYFEAKTNAFSPFAIVGVIKSGIIQPTQPILQQTQIAATTPAITGSNTKYENATGFLAGILGFALPRGGSSVIMDLTIALLIIVVIYRLILRKRK